MNKVQRLAAGVSPKWSDINTLVKASVDNRVTYTPGIADKAILATFPRLARYAFEIPFHVLVESGVVALQQCVILCRENDLRCLCVKTTSQQRNDKKSDRRRGVGIRCKGTAEHRRL